jgi:hypothetical protein
MGVRRDDPIEDRRRALMRQAATRANHKFSLSGREKEGGYAPRTPSLPKMPWDDEPENDPGGD